MKWSEEEVTRLESLVNGGMNASHIAVEIGRSRNSVKQKIQALGLQPVKGKGGIASPYTTDQKSLAIKLWVEGLTTNEIAQETGIQWGTLRKMMSDDRLNFPKRETTKAFVFQEKPTPETVTIQYEYREIPAPEGALSKPFFCTEVGECSWILEDFWTEPKYDSPCCGLPVYDRKGGGLKRTYCNYHYEASLEKKDSK